MSKQEETDVKTKILLKSGEIPGLTLYKNVVGQFRAMYGNGRVTVGLCPGSSDLVGYQTITITQDMVGDKIAQFVAVEVKTTKKDSKEGVKQQEFRHRTNGRGGYSIVVRSEEELIESFKGRS